MDQLKQILSDRGISATSLEQMMSDKGYKLSRISIGNILNGKHSPKLDTLEQIAGTLNVDVCDLIQSSGKVVKDVFVLDESGQRVKIGEINSDQIRKVIDLHTNT